MNTSSILKEAWRILRTYRVLWIFGFLLAMTTVTWETALLETLNDRQANQGLSIQSEDFNFNIPGADVTIDLDPADGFVILFDNNIKDAITVDIIVIIIGAVIAQVSYAVTVTIRIVDDK